MAIQIDLAAGTVARAGEAWPLSLDCRDGTVTVTIDGVAHRLRPLRWREKQLLARVAAYGPELVARQRVAITRLEGTDEVGDGVAEVLAAVADWLDDPDSALPLQREALAAVTVDLCRAAGLRPADLDDRDAAEVEAWWRVTVAGSRATEPTASMGRPTARTQAPTGPAPLAASVVAPVPWADANTIRFDPAPPDEHLAREPDEPSASQHDRGGPVVDPAPGPSDAPPIIESAPHEPDAPPAPRPAPAPAAPARTVLPHRPVVPEFEWGGGAEARGRDPRTSLRAGLGAPDGHSGRRPGGRQLTSVRFGSGGVRAKRVELAPGPAVNLAASAPGVVTEPLAAPCPGRIEPGDSPRPVPTPAPGVTDAVLDELVERLEQAAADLGIEV